MTPRLLLLLISDYGIATEVIAAGLGGFLAWVLTKTVAYVVLRNRLISYLLVVINVRLRQYQDFLKWLSAVREDTIKEGFVIKLAANYTKDDLHDLTEVRKESLKFLRMREFIRVTKLIQRMSEVEALLDGFALELQGYREREQKLDSSDVDFLKRKQDRIISYIRVLPQKIAKLTDLPVDYSGIEGAETLVTSASAVRQDSHQDQ